MDFPIQRADLLIDYGDVDLADGARFVLPEQALNISCPGIASVTAGYQLTFRHWHKFAAGAGLDRRRNPDSATIGICG